MISVIVCTFNRSASLARTLARLTQCAPPEPVGPWELIVVDNNSSDDTPAVVAQCQQRAAIPVRYLFEGHQGLSFARNTGVEAANGDIIAFTDDDCCVDTSWLVVIQDEFSRDAQLGAMAGRVEPGPGVDPRVGTRRQREPANITSLQDIRRYMMGANISFRKSVWLSVGPFDTCLGAGTGGRSGEDIDFMFRALRDGQKLAYSPNALVEHWHDRLSTDALVALRRGYITGRGAFTMKWLLAFELNLSKTLYWNLLSLFRPNTAPVRSSPGISNWTTAICLIRGAFAWLSGTLYQKTFR